MIPTHPPPIWHHVEKNVFPTSDRLFTKNINSAVIQTSFPCTKNHSPLKILDFHFLTLCVFTSFFSLSSKTKNKRKEETKAKDFLVYANPMSDQLFTNSINSAEVKTIPPCNKNLSPT